jgi:hypothetical protein
VRHAPHMDELYAIGEVRVGGWEQKGQRKARHSRMCQHTSHLCPFGCGQLVMNRPKDQTAELPCSEQQHVEVLRNTKKKRQPCAAAAAATPTWYFSMTRQQRPGSGWLGVDPNSTCTRQNAATWSKSDVRW